MWLLGQKRPNQLIFWSVVLAWKFPLHKRYQRLFVFLFVCFILCQTKKKKNESQIMSFRSWRLFIFWNKFYQPDLHLAYSCLYSTLIVFKKKCTHTCTKVQTSCVDSSLTLYWSFPLGIKMRLVLSNSCISDIVGDNNVILHFYYVSLGTDDQLSNSTFGQLGAFILITCISFITSSPYWSHAAVGC